MRVRSGITDPASVARWVAHRIRTDAEASRLIDAFTLGGIAY
jgi:hypothetical protein